MSQPDLAYLWSSDQPLAQPDPSQSSPVASTPVSYQVLLDELAQAKALDHERVARIYHLEQALDQALACLDELKLQVHDQAFLETQLATTEEFAYVQQQAIARLKLQLNQQRQTLEAQTIEIRERDRTVQALLTTTETIATAQQGELERLRSRLAQDQIEVQVHRSRLEQQHQDLQNALASRQQRVLELESESLASRTLNAQLEIQLNAAQQQIQQLCLSLSQHQTSLSNLEAQLAETQLAQSQLAQLQLAQSQLAQSQLASEPEHLTCLAANQPIRDNQHLSAPELQQELAISQIKVEELETQLAKQVKLQARWQQSFQELDVERDRYQSRLGSLEKESAEMQEQILQQARQASEYETAVQHWKDRYFASQQQLTQLRGLIERLPQPAADLQSPDCQREQILTPALSELLAIIQQLLAAATETQTLLPGASPRLNPLELPDFLARRRIYRAK